MAESALIRSRTSSGMFRTVMLAIVVLSFYFCTILIAVKQIPTATLRPFLGASNARDEMRRNNKFALAARAETITEIWQSRRQLHPDVIADKDYFRTLAYWKFT
jgi:hypothetical protein